MVVWSDKKLHYLASMIDTYGRDWVEISEIMSGKYKERYTPESCRSAYARNKHVIYGIIGVKNSMTFSEALEALKEGKKVKRKHWGGYWFIPNNVTVTEDIPWKWKNTHVMNEMIVAKLKDGGGYVPASPYQEDLLSNDWEEVK